MCRVKVTINYDHEVIKRGKSRLSPSDRFITEHKNVEQKKFLYFGVLPIKCREMFILKFLLTFRLAIDRTMRYRKTGVFCQAKRQQKFENKHLSAFYRQNTKTKKVQSS